MGWLSNHVGNHSKKRIKNDGRAPKKLWHDLLDEFTAEFEKSTFFAGDEPVLWTLLLMDT